MIENPIFLRLNDFLKNKKILISLGVSIFAIQSLISIIYFSVNFPMVDDWPVVYLSVHYLQNDPIWFNLLLAHDNEHYLYTYRSIMMLGFLLNSFNVQQFMFLNWALLLTSVGIFYVLLKKSNKQLTWLIIPISAFVFNPKMVSVNFISSFGLQWIGTFFFIISITGILYKEKLSKFWFGLAIGLSLMATFNTFLGLLSWIVGTLILIQNFKKNKIKFLVWICISIIIFSFYFSDMKFEPRENSLLTAISSSGISWGLQYVSTAFSVGSLELRVLIGAISISSLILTSVYLLKKRVSISYPWIIFGVIGILATIVITGGRFGIRPPYENYLIPMSLFIQISLLVLLTILFFEIRKSKKKIKTMFTIFYVLFIIGQLMLFISAYFVGYQYVSEWHSEKSNWLTCFDLPSNSDVCYYWHPFGNKYDNEKTGINQDGTIYNILIEKKLSIFSNNEFFFNQEQKKMDLDIAWNNLKEGPGSGDIEVINGVNISNELPIILNSSRVNISGWLVGDNKIDEIYLFIDGKSFLKNSNFNSRFDIVNKLDSISTPNIGWDITFWSAFLEDGCHDLSVGGVYDNNKFVLEKHVEICKK